MDTTETTVEPDYKLTFFQKRVADQRERLSLLTEWHLQAYTEAGVDLPYNGDDSYINANRWVDNGEGRYEGGVNAEATIDYLSKIVKFARSKGKQVLKNYSGDFTIEVVISTEPEISVNYYASRETVCTKKVTGTEVIAARTIPEQIKETVEWECEKLVFSQDKDNG